MYNNPIDVIVGTAGNQGFPIKCKFASHQHCRITYDPMTRYFTVTDLGSSNGTWIVDDSNGLENLQFVPINQVVVAPGTWLNLGGTDPGTGHRLLVDHLLKSDPNDYSSEFRIYNQALANYHESLEDLERKQKRSQKVFAGIKLGFSVIVMGAIMLLSGTFPFLKQPGVMMCASSLLMAVCSFLNFDTTRETGKRLRKNASNYFLCPKCGKPLSEFSIHQRACASCQAQ